MRPPAQPRSPTRASIFETFVNRHFGGNTLPKGMGIQLPFNNSGPKVWYGVNGLAELIVREAAARNNGVVRAPGARRPMTHTEKAEVMRRTRITNGNKRAIRARATAARTSAVRKIGRTQEEINYHAGRMLQKEYGFGGGPRRAGVQERPSRKAPRRTARATRKYPAKRP